MRRVAARRPRRRVVTGALFVAFEPPKARYECLLCRRTEGPVTGYGRVRVFVEKIREVHRGRCPAAASNAPASRPGPGRRGPGAGKDCA